MKSDAENNENVTQEPKKRGRPFTSENQPSPDAKSRKGIRNWDTVFKDALNAQDGYMPFTDAEEIGNDGKPTGRIFKLCRVKMPSQEAIVLAMARKAIQGSEKAAKLIMDRMDGLPKQSIKLETEDGVEVLSIVRMPDNNRGETSENR